MALKAFEGALCRTCGNRRSAEDSVAHLSEGLCE